MTLPSWVELTARPGRRPAAGSRRPAAASRASASVLPSTPGTGTGSAPLDTTIVTSVPFGTVWPGGGRVRITLPAATVSLGSCDGLHLEAGRGELGCRGDLVEVGHVRHGRLALAGRHGQHHGAADVDLAGLRVLGQHRALGLVLALLRGRATA